MPVAERSALPREFPTEVVLDAFGASDAEVQPLTGGEETSARVGRFVFKQVQDVRLAIWCQELLANTTSTRFRLPKPTLSGDDRWAVDGWIASELVEDLTSLRSDPERVIDIGEALSDALGAAAAPGDLGPVLGRQDRWARADRFVWGEEDIDLTDSASELADRLRGRMSGTTDHSQIVHGDLSGNVFIDPSGVPVVLHDDETFWVSSGLTGYMLECRRTRSRHGPPAASTLAAPKCRHRRSDSEATPVLGERPGSGPRPTRSTLGDYVCIIRTWQTRRLACQMM